MSENIEYDEGGAPVADHDAVAADSWDKVLPPSPVQHGRWKLQVLVAIYKKPENEGEEHLYSFLVKFVEPPVGVSEEELPEDWATQKPFWRFRIPSRNSFFEVKELFKAFGINVEGKTRAQTNEALKALKPEFYADVDHRSWISKTTGLPQFEYRFRKVRLASLEHAGEEPVDAAA